MLTTVPLANRPDFTVSAVTCRSDHTRWSPAETYDAYRLVLVRTGRFRRRASGDHTDLDTTRAYVGAPSDEEQFAHPSGGDVCTSITVAPHLWHALAGDAATPDRHSLYVDAPVDLAHRRVLASARAGDVDYALCEDLLALLAAAVRDTVDAPTPSRPRPRAADRALVAAARDAILEDHPASGTLVSLADLLDASPYRLSRAFPRELGVTITRFRHRVRLARALDRLESGETDLAALAADLGYADQPHLTRTARDHLGQTPTTLRRLLTP
ncbi:helix-turn-helix domain-containing protein [Actinomadura harenae]|uniref:AraC family transcriptional regulator n=1 Tax=Actinomadura harenae TaxID=2483351 RepID=A0A3M2LQY5_9ACTN|nr:AraC family transcriptional regulator [Actinomadura harenae]RMI39496.1 AraC family transcriptional regulator [Actinomadura harenae]